MTCDMQILSLFQLEAKHFIEQVPVLKWLYDCEVTIN